MADDKVDGGMTDCGSWSGSCRLSWMDAVVGHRSSRTFAGCWSWRSHQVWSLFVSCVINQSSLDGLMSSFTRDPRVLGSFAVHHLYVPALAPPRPHRSMTQIHPSAARIPPSYYARSSSTSYIVHSSSDLVSSFPAVTHHRQHQKTMFTGPTLMAPVSAVAEFPDSVSAFTMSVPCPPPN
jgi:hypothetical protein